MRVSAKRLVLAAMLFAATLMGANVKVSHGFEPTANIAANNDPIVRPISYLGNETTESVPACEADCDCVPRLLGFIAPSDQCFSDFISPMTNPVFFEDPRTLSELRFIVMNHVIPNRAPLVGGDVQLLAMQVRAALTDRLSIIATSSTTVSRWTGSCVTDGAESRL